MVEVLRHKFGKVLVIVDTAIRFFKGADENSSVHNLNKDSEKLRSHGANVAFMHHAGKPKFPKKGNYVQNLLNWMTSESVLRGTSDFAAMADCVYGFVRDEIKRNNGKGPEEVICKCCKPRDMDEPPLPFRLVLRRSKDESVIDKTGDLEYRSLEDDEDEHKKQMAEQLDKLAAIIKADPRISQTKLAKELHTRKENVPGLLAAGGWEWDDKGWWRFFEACA